MHSTRKAVLLVATLLVSLSLAVVSTTSSASDSLVTLKSAHSVTKTGDRLEAVLKAKGMTLFTRINHADGAKKVGKALRPTEVIIFGNPKVGTPLMQCAQTVAIDLPQKALIYEDESGNTWFTYNDPAYLAERHSIMGCEKVINKISGALGKFAAKATSAN